MMIAVEQRLGKTVTVVGRAHLVPELLESLAIGRRDLRVHGVEKRQGGQQVLTRSALTAGVLTDSLHRGDWPIRRTAARAAVRAGHP